jgi:antirestriction protein ArdC
MDIRQQVTDTIIELIEQGPVKGESLWDAAVKFGMPLNYQTKRPYNGINVLMLCAEASQRGFSCNEWLTFKQAQAMGAMVRKGAKGVLGVFFKMRERKGATADEPDSKIPMLSPFWVFNVDDIEGLPIVAAAAREPFDPIEEAERMLNASGARITWKGAQAFFRPSTDEIWMPDRERFSSAANAYAVALHELTHWTGHESRLHRDFSGRAGSDPYAFEELVAELGAAYLVAHLGLQGAKLENHACYLQHYLQILKNDKTAIFTAARLASQAFDHILALTSAPAQVDACSEGAALLAA